MKKFMVTFDLRHADESDYERVYARAHSMGGYRYFQFNNGTWGRLPSTTVVIPLNANTVADATEEFCTVLKSAGLDPSHVALADGVRWFSLAAIQPSEVPDYAKQRAPVYV